MLILAGVTMSVLTGKNGMITRAREAKVAKENAEKDEEHKLSNMDKIMNEFMEDEEDKINEEISKIDPWDGQTSTTFAGGDGTEANPYIIENAEQLVYFANQVNSGERFNGKFVSIVKSINLGNKEFTPIGLGTTGNRGEAEWNMGNYFNGTLDGNNNIITGVKITQPEVHGVGIIGTLGERGTVKNLRTYEGTVIGRTCVGGIVGAGKGQIINCTNYLSVIAQDIADAENSGQIAGGIVGFAPSGFIDNCKNFGEVITKDDIQKTMRGKYAGGIVGFSNVEKAFTISNCINEGNVTAVYQQAGGIIGSTESSKNKLTLVGCKNTGRIETEQSTQLSNGGFVGGIIGLADSETEIEDCHNEGEVVEGKQIAGGIVGFFSKGTIKNCSNKGNVKTLSDYLAGGIAGALENGNIENCSNSGKIIAQTQQAGGIVGQVVNGTIVSCTNTGEVIAKSQQVGGIIARIVKGTIRNCINNGKITSDDITTGGIVGWTITECDIENCTNNGEIIADGQGAGGIVAAKYDNGTINNCTNTGKVKSNSKNYRGIAGGIVAVQTAGTINNVYNSGEIITGKYSNEKVEAIGGIVGYFESGSISKAYNKGTISGGDAVGGIIGQKKTAATVEKTYYYTSQNIKGIGSESDDNSEIKSIEDSVGKVEKTTKNIESLDKFLKAEMP